MPLFIGGIGAALSFLQLIVELRASRGAHEEQIDLRKDLPIYLWVWAFVGAVVGFGFVIAAPIMLFAYLRWRSRESWWLVLFCPRPYSASSTACSRRCWVCRCSKGW